MSVAGYLTTVNRSGTSTAMTDEAMSNTAGNTWQIDDTARRVWDRTVVPSFEDNTVPIPAGDILSIDYLFGTVTFTASKTGPITVSGNYLPITAIAGAYRYALNLARVSLEDTTYVAAQANGGFKTYITGLTDISVTIGRREELDSTFFDLLTGRNPILVEVHPGGSGVAFRGWKAAESEVHSGTVDDQEERELTLQMDATSEAAFGFGNP